MLKQRILLSVLAIVMVIAGVYYICFAGPAEVIPADLTPLTIEGYEISKPVTFRNLSIFFITGPNRADLANFLTLEEAMEEKMVVVHETGNVNTLSVENTSKVPVFIHAGDIIRGGKQDRMLPNDMILRPNSGKIPVDSFCVEQGRWQQRGKEKVSGFSSSKNVAGSNAMKIAGRRSSKQGYVWREVSNKQSKLAKAVSPNVRSSQSSSSLELTLSSKEVEKAQKEYQAAFKDALNGKENVIGFAVGINGKPYSADIYVSDKLFAKLWGKLLKAAVIEAMAEYKKDLKITEVTSEQISNFLQTTLDGKSTSRKIYEDVFLRIVQNKEQILFATYDLKLKCSIHDSYVIDTTGSEASADNSPDRNYSPRSTRRRNR